MADYWTFFHGYFSSGPCKSLGDFRRFEFCRIGHPEVARGESLSPYCAGVKSMLTRHLHPISMRELNRPELRAVWTPCRQHLCYRRVQGSRCAAEAAHIRTCNDTCLPTPKTHEYFQLSGYALSLILSISSQRSEYLQLQFYV